MPEDINDIVKSLREKFGNTPLEKKAAILLGCFMAEHNILDLKTLIDMQMLANSLITYCHKQQKHLISPELMQIFKKENKNAN